MRHGCWALTIAVAASIASAEVKANYDLTFSTTGSPTVGGSVVGATARFIGTGTTLQIILTDTVATASRTQLLSGVFFDIVGGSAASTPTYSTPTAVVTPGNSIYTDATTPVASTAGSPYSVTGAFLFGQDASGLGTTSGPPSLTISQQYGVSATGDSPLFPSGSFTKGGGSDDYALAGPGTALGAKSLGSAFPLILSSVTITITGINIGTGISDVLFPFGSGPSGTAAGAFTPVPEPASAASLLAGLALIAARRAGGGARRGRSSAPRPSR